MHDTWWLRQFEVLIVDLVEEETSLFVVDHKKSLFAHFIHFELIESIQVLEIVAIFDGKTLRELLDHDYYVRGKEN